MATQMAPKECETNQREDHTTGIHFNPPLYLQRYNLCTKYIEQVRPRKLIDFGCAEGKFIRVLRGKNYDFLQKILGVDIDPEVLESSKQVVLMKKGNYNKNRTTPLNIAVYQGSLTEWDPRLDSAGFVSLIEVIEHLHDDILTLLPPSIFGRLRPKHVLITTPNSEFNILFKNLNGFRHPDHKFEWTRDDFMSWCEAVCQSFPYLVEFCGVGEPPMGMEEVGYCSQAAFFSLKPEVKTEPNFRGLVRGNVKQTPKTKIASSKPKLDQSSPKLQPSKPKSEKSSPKSEKSSPKLGQSKPKSEKSSPKLGQSKPKSEQSSPKLEQSKPKSEQSKPKSEQSSPKSEQSKPKSEQSSPKIETTKSNLETSTPNSDAPKSKSIETKPKIEQSNLKMEPTNSTLELSRTKTEQAEYKPEPNQPNSELTDTSKVEDKLRVDPKYFARVSELKSAPKLQKSQHLTYTEVACKEFP